MISRGCAPGGERRCGYLTICWARRRRRFARRSRHSRFSSLSRTPCIAGVDFTLAMLGRRSEHPGALGWSASVFRGSGQRLDGRALPGSGRDSVPGTEYRIFGRLPGITVLSGQVFVFTGFRDEVLAARIGNAGGDVASGISRRVTTLLVEDIDARPTGKVKKAQEYGIEIRSRKSFEQEFCIG